MASIFKIMGLTEKAISSYKKALNLNPDLLYAYFEIGMLLIKRQRPEEAKEFFELAIKQN